MLIILIYCSFYIPFVAAFENEEIIYNVSKWIFSIIFCNLLFLFIAVDIIILMRMCYYDENNNLV